MRKVVYKDGNKFVYSVLDSSETKLKTSNDSIEGDIGWVLIEYIREATEEEIEANQRLD